MVFLNIVQSIWAEFGQMVKCMIDCIVVLFLHVMVIRMTEHLTGQKSVLSVLTE